MKIIHTSDLHLESRLSSSFPPALSTERRRELLFTFKKLFAYAKGNDVRAILIAGDLFDSGKIPARTVNDILSTLKAYPEIEVYYLCGNHDENNLASLTSLPSNIHTFGKQTTYYTLDDIVIAGSEGEIDLSLSPDTKNIVMLHGQITDRTGKHYVDLSACKNQNVDYLALGHIHSFELGKLDDRGIYAYAGCLEGRGFDECGEKGFVLLDVGEKIVPTFVPFASMSLHEVEIKLDKDDTETYDVEQKIEKELTFPQTDMVKIVFTGERNPDLSFDLGYFEGKYRASYRFAKVEDKTRLAVFADDFKTDISLKGEFVRMVRSSKLKAEKQDKILECGIRALRGEEL